ncbi:MAG: Crp/Fnr family transcriptional regulator [Proteobacteria bacterium]|nr:Crp/Fnr family transcriptional regulator [Pseudomonadota bacterium]
MAPAQPTPTTSAAAAHRLLARSTALCGLPCAALAELAHHATVHCHRGGETLFHEGDEARHCLIVEHGAVQLLRYDADGEERLLQHCEAHQLVAEAAMFMPHGRYPMTARTQGDSRLWRIPRHALHSACGCHPALALRLLQRLGACLNQQANEVDWLTRCNAAQRLAGYLLALPRAPGDQIQLPSSQRHLAARLGVRAETVNRLLAQWQAQGWINGARRSWQLCRLQPLQQLAAAGAPAF